MMDPTPIRICKALIQSQANYFRIKSITRENLNQTMNLELVVAVNVNNEITEYPPVEVEQSSVEEEPTMQPQEHTEPTNFAGYLIIYTLLFCVHGAIYMVVMLQPQGVRDFFDIGYPIFSVLALMSVHLFMYGCNLVAWNKTGVRSNLIFMFQPATALDYRDAFCISTCMMAFVDGAMVLCLILGFHEFSSGASSFIPYITIPIFVIIMLWPFNFLYHSTRYYFLRVMRNIMCAPFYTVMLVDVFMGDQLTSQVPLLRHLEAAACYLYSGSFKRHPMCESGKLYKELSFIISFAPYYWRAMQCARRWRDERDISHIANLGKYVSAMIAGGARIAYMRQRTLLRLVIVGVTFVIAVGYQLYWDFVKDWGLLDRKSQNPWLRDNLLLKKKALYFTSMALNFIMRFAWLETLMKLNVGVLTSHLLDFVFASIEVIRRGHWNYYRLEYEHMMSNAPEVEADRIDP